jgi:hypothetical protein
VQRGQRLATDKEQGPPIPGVGPRKRETDAIRRPRDERSGVHGYERSG